jgi:hypothetical protein
MALPEAPPDATLPRYGVPLHLRVAAIRLVLGLVVCIWIIAHLFMLPKDAEGYRTWVYLGVALAPLALACAVAVW